MPVEVIPVVAIENPATFPPENNTCDPVISPEDFSTRLS